MPLVYEGLHRLAHQHIYYLYTRQYGEAIQQYEKDLQLYSIRLRVRSVSNSEMPTATPTLRHGSYARAHERGY